MRLLILIFCLITLHVNAQDTLRVLSIGASAQISWCDRIVSTDAEHEFLKHQYDSLEMGRILGGGGFMMNYKLNKYLDIQSGINYLSRGYAIDTLAEAGIFNLHYNYKYVDVPVQLSIMTRITKKVQPCFAIGISYQYMVKHETKYSEIGSNAHKTFNDLSGVNKSNLSLRLAIGITRSISEKDKLQLMALMNQSVTPLSNTPLKRYLNSYGIQIAITHEI